MFRVKGLDGNIYVVYAVSGSRFLVWDDSTEEEHWEWKGMEQFRPLTMEDD